MTNSREAFEEKAEAWGFDISKRFNNTYHNMQTQGAWEILNSTVEQEPYGYVDGFGNFESSKKAWMEEEPNVHWKPLYTQPQPDSKLVEENARLCEALDACLLMCDFSSIPAIEKSAREALNKEGD